MHRLNPAVEFCRITVVEEREQGEDRQDASVMEEDMEIEGIKGASPRLLEKHGAHRVEVGNRLFAL